MKESNANFDNSPKIVVGLDIGTTKIATIIGYETEDEKIDILGYGKGESTGVQHGLIYNINKTVDGINVSKEQAENRSNFNVSKVYVGIAGRHIKSVEYRHVCTRINGKNEIIRQEEIDKMLNDLRNISVPLGERIIDVIPQRYVIDKERETTDPVGEMGELVVGYFQIITGNENEIKKILMCVDFAGLKAEDIILEPIASGLACLSEDEKKQGVALIDIGGGTTDLAIYYDGKPVFTKVIPIGGNIITKDIANVCRITEEFAEKIKVSFGTCIVDKSNVNNYISLPRTQAAESQPRQINESFLAKIINMRVQTDILDQIKAEIENSGYSDKLIAGVVLTGGGSTLKNIRELCQYTLQKSTRIGVPEFGFVRSIPNDLKHPMYSTSLGLLKYGISSSKDVNLVEEVDVEEEEDTDDEKQESIFGSLKRTKTKKEDKEKENTNKRNKIVPNLGRNVLESIQDFFEELISKNS